jgi:hypothetical protein
MRFKGYQYTSQMPLSRGGATACVKEGVCFHAFKSQIVNRKSKIH